MQVKVYMFTHKQYLQEKYKNKQEKILDGNIPLNTTKYCTKNLIININKH